MRKLFPVFIVFISIFLSCHSEQTTAAATLKVVFSDYHKDAFRVYLLDPQGNDYEEMYDSVMMKVLTDGDWHDLSYLILLSENPIRAQFQTMNSEFTIILDKQYLLMKDNAPVSPHISSGDISFR